MAHSQIFSTASDFAALSPLQAYYHLYDEYRATAEAIPVAVCSIDLKERERENIMTGFTAAMAKTPLLKSGDSLKKMYNEIHLKLEVMAGFYQWDEDHPVFNFTVGDQLEPVNPQYARDCEPVEDRLGCKPGLIHRESTASRKYSNLMVNYLCACKSPGTTEERKDNGARRRLILESDEDTAFPLSSPAASDDLEGLESSSVQLHSPLPLGAELRLAYLATLNSENNDTDRRPAEQIGSSPPRAIFGALTNEQIHQSASAVRARARYKDWIEERLKASPIKPIDLSNTQSSPSHPSRRARDSVASETINTVSEGEEMDVSRSEEEDI